MPLFYFDTKIEDQLSEEDVFDLAGISAAKAEAVRYLAEASVYHLTEAGPLVCIVRDERKRALFRVSLTLTIDELNEKTRRS